MSMLSIACGVYLGVSGYLVSALTYKSYSKYKIGDETSVINKNTMEK